MATEIPDDALLLDESRWEKLDNWTPPGEGEDFGKRLINRLLKLDEGKAFLLLARFYTGKRPDLAEAAGHCLWHIAVVSKCYLRIREVWDRVPKEVRRALIDDVFKANPGEPFEVLRDWDHSLLKLAHRWMGKKRWPTPLSVVPPPLFPLKYVPSRQVASLREMVEATGDTESLRLIDERIEQHRSACNIVPVVFGPEVFGQCRKFVFSRDAQELVARLITLARRAGFRSTVLPEVCLSHEAPPAFVANPELEDAEDEDAEESQEERRPRIPRDRQRPVPEVFSIEELLGCYGAKTSSIVLWVRGIYWAARRYDIPPDLLTEVVLIHEIGHWIAHKLPAPQAAEWPLDLYLQTSEEFHECWAQLMVWYVADAVGGDFRDGFEKLNTRQPLIYRLWEGFRTVSPSVAFKALVHLRRSRLPAEMRDWEALVA